MPTQDRVPEPPERLGPYRLDQLLGSGGMGAVWRAWDERLERWVALKQIRADATLRHGRERFRREARAAARLNHPSIVQVYDILESGDGDWIVMELVEGRTLRDLLDEESALSPARAVKLCRETVEGLAEAHANGILHRDLKASNVIVSASGRAKILDFGLAKEIPREGLPDFQEPRLTTPGAVLGTCFAMSPEQVLGLPLDGRSDLFSLGSLLYEMLTGEPPFLAETPAQSLARVLQTELPPLQKSHPALPPAVCDLVDWLLQKEARDRPQSAAEVLAALATAAGSADWEAVPALRPPPSRLEAAAASTLVDRPAARSAQAAERPRSSGALEQQILLDRFRLARSGAGQAVLIAGEAGIGKSRLIRALSEQLAAEAPAWLIAYGSAVARSLPLSPIIGLLERTIFAAERGVAASGEQRLDRLEELLEDYDLPRPENAPLLGALFSLPVDGRYPPLLLSPTARRNRTLAAVLALLAGLAERDPVVLVIEDLQWVDSSTLDFVDLLLRELPMLPLLLVVTFRPEFTAPWPHQTSVTQLSLGG